MPKSNQQSSSPVQVLRKLGEGGDGSSPVVEPVAERDIDIVEVLPLSQLLDEAFDTLGDSGPVSVPSSPLSPAGFSPTWARGRREAMGSPETESSSPLQESDRSVSEEDLPKSEGNRDVDSFNLGYSWLVEHAETDKLSSGRYFGCNVEVVRMSRSAEVIEDAGGAAEDDDSMSEDSEGRESTESDEYHDSESRAKDAHVFFKLPNLGPPRSTARVLTLEREVPQFWGDATRNMADSATASWRVDLGKTTADAARLLSSEQKLKALVESCLGKTVSALRGYFQALSAPVNHFLSTKLINSGAIGVICIPNDPNAVLASPSLDSPLSRVTISRGKDGHLLFTAVEKNMQMRVREQRIRLTGNATTAFRLCDDGRWEVVSFSASGEVARLMEAKGGEIQGLLQEKIDKGMITSPVPKRAARAISFPEKVVAAIEKGTSPEDKQERYLQQVHKYASGRSLGGSREKPIKTAIDLLVNGCAGVTWESMIVVRAGTGKKPIISDQDWVSLLKSGSDHSYVSRFQRAGHADQIGRFAMVAVPAAVRYYSAARDKKHKDYALSALRAVAYLASTADHKDELDAFRHRMYFCAGLSDAQPSSNGSLDIKDAQLGKKLLSLCPNIVSAVYSDSSSASNALEVAMDVGKAMQKFAKEAKDAEYETDTVKFVNGVCRPFVLDILKHAVSTLCTIDRGLGKVAECLGVQLSDMLAWCSSEDLISLLEAAMDYANEKMDFSHLQILVPIIDQFLPFYNTLEGYKALALRVKIDFVEQANYVSVMLDKGWKPEPDELRGIEDKALIRICRMRDVSTDTVSFCRDEMINRVEQLVGTDIVGSFRNMCARFEILLDEGVSFLSREARAILFNTVRQQNPISDYDVLDAVVRSLDAAPTAERKIMPDHLTQAHNSLVTYYIQQTDPVIAAKAYYYLMRDEVSVDAETVASMTVDQWLCVVKGTKSIRPPISVAEVLTSLNQKVHSPEFLACYHFYSNDDSIKSLFATVKHSWAHPSTICLIRSAMISGLKSFIKMEADGEIGHINRIFALILNGMLNSAESMTEGNDTSTYAADIASVENARKALDEYIQLMNEEIQRYAEDDLSGYAVLISMFEGSINNLTLMEKYFTLCDPAAVSKMTPVAYQTAVVEIKEPYDFIKVLLRRSSASPMSDSVRRCVGQYIVAKEPSLMTASSGIIDASLAAILLQAHLNNSEVCAEFPHLLKLCSSASEPAFTFTLSIDSEVKVPVDKAVTVSVKYFEEEADEAKRTDFISRIIGLTVVPPALKVGLCAGILKSKHVGSLDQRLLKGLIEGMGGETQDEINKVVLPLLKSEIEGFSQKVVDAILYLSNSALKQSCCVVIMQYESIWTKLSETTKEQVFNLACPSGASIPRGFIDPLSYIDVKRLRADLSANHTEFDGLIKDKKLVDLFKYEGEKRLMLLGRWLYLQRNNAGIIRQLFEQPEPVVTGVDEVPAELRPKMTFKLYLDALKYVGTDAMNRAEKHQVVLSLLSIVFSKAGLNEIRTALALFGDAAPTESQMDTRPRSPAGLGLEEDTGRDSSNLLEDVSGLRGISSLSSAILAELALGDPRFVGGYDSLGGKIENFEEGYKLKQLGELWDKSRSSAGNEQIINLTSLKLSGMPANGAADVELNRKAACAEMKARVLAGGLFFSTVSSELVCKSCFARASFTEVSDIWTQMDAALRGARLDMTKVSTAFDGVESWGKTLSNPVEVAFVQGDLPSELPQGFTVYKSGILFNDYFLVYPKDGKLESHKLEPKELGGLLEAIKKDGAALFMPQPTAENEDTLSQQIRTKGDVKTREPARLIYNKDGKSKIPEQGTVLLVKLVRGWMRKTDTYTLEKYVDGARVLTSGLPKKDFPLLRTYRGHLFSSDEEKRARKSTIRRISQQVLEMVGEDLHGDVPLSDRDLPMIYMTRSVLRSDWLARDLSDEIRLLEVKRESKEITEEAEKMAYKHFGLKPSKKSQVTTVLNVEQRLWVDDSVAKRQDLWNIYHNVGVGLVKAIDSGYKGADFKLSKTGLALLSGPRFFAANFSNVSGTFKLDEDVFDATVKVLRANGVRFAKTRCRWRRWRAESWLKKHEGFLPMRLGTVSGEGHGQSSASLVGDAIAAAQSREPASVQTDNMAARRQPADGQPPPFIPPSASASRDQFHPPPPPPSI